MPLVVFVTWLKLPYGKVVPINTGAKEDEVKPADSVMIVEPGPIPN
jgi:hypothetical protein